VTACGMLDREELRLSGGRCGIHSFLPCREGVLSVFTGLRTMRISKKQCHPMAWNNPDIGRWRGGRDLRDQCNALMRLPEVRGFGRYLWGRIAEGLGGGFSCQLGEDFLLQEMMNFANIFDFRGAKLIMRKGARCPV
jgi:hypothetical protein